MFSALAATSVPSIQGPVIVGPLLLLIVVLIGGVFLAVVLPKYRKQLGVLLLIVGVLSVIPFFLVIVGFANTFNVLSDSWMFVLGSINLFVGAAIFVYKPKIQAPP